MITTIIGRGGEVTLPSDVQERYGLRPEVSVRLIETRSGLLLVPLTDAPMGEELALEIQEWQALGAETWAQFPYEDVELSRKVFKSLDCVDF